MGDVRYAPDGTWSMQNAGTGPCRTWPIDPTCSCFEDQEIGGEPPWPATMERAVEIATEYLWRRTAGRYGLCWELLRPCPAPGPEWAPRGGLAWPDPHGAPSARSGWSQSGGLGPFPSGGDGQWGGWLGVCGCGGPCGCGPSPEIQLPGPVWQDLSRDYPHGRQYTVDVFIDGTRMPDNTFRVLDNGYLVPVGGWSLPGAQDLSRPAIPEPGTVPSDYSGTWGIRYWRGLQVPAGGVQAVTQLACELWKACDGWGSNCRLPGGLREQLESVEREGISYKMVDPNQDMLINMPDVGGWVQSVNPRGMLEQPFVVSPDLPRFHSESRRSPVWGPVGRGWR